MVFSGTGSWPHLSLEPSSEPVPMPVVGAETPGLFHTGERLFIFRNLKDPEVSLHVPPRRKKNFLNAKKATWTLGSD